VADSTAAYHPRLKAALVAAALLALWGAIENFQLENRANDLHDPYMVNDQPRRLTAAMQLVPRTAIVGYISDLPDQPVAWLAIFNSARYTVAPRLLVDGTDHEWVLGNFSKPGDYAAIGREHGVQIVQDFGDGVALYRGAVK
jgi:hypothetical protein